MDAGSRDPDRSDSICPARSRSRFRRDSHAERQCALCSVSAKLPACILMLNPRTTIRGAWRSLVAVFVLAIVVHLLHGLYQVGNLAIYTAAAWAVAVGKNS